jgi:hypothetical protein
MCHVFAVEVGDLYFSPFTLDLSLRTGAIAMEQFRTLSGEAVDQQPQVNQHHVERFGIGRFFVMLFWLHQIFLGLPSMAFGVQLLIRKSDGTMDMIGLVLTWIGGTLCWGFAVMLHERYRFRLPKTFPVRLGPEETPAAREQDGAKFDRTYRGFPYRQKVGRVEVLTADGVQTYPNMNEFRRAVD